MIKRMLITAAAMASALMASPAPAQDQTAIDDAISERMMAQASPVRSGRIHLWTLPEAMTDAEALAFAGELAKGLEAIEALTGERFDTDHYGSAAIEVFVSPKVTVSHVYGGYAHPQFRHPYLYLNPRRVMTKTAPYLHELTHIVLWDYGSHSLREGFASFVEGRLASDGIGYNSGVFGPGPRQDVDAAAARLLGGDTGAKVLPWIGKSGGTDPSITEASSPETREAFYLLTRSFVQHLLDTVDMATFVKLYRAKDTEAAYAALTGRSLEEWRTSWQKSLTR